MKLPLQSQIRFMGRFRRFKPGLAVAHAVCHKLHDPFTLVPANAEKPNFVGFSGFAHVLKVAEPRHLAQVAKTVVALIAVYVVDMLRWPFTSHVSPRETMRELLAVMNGYGPVARRMFGSRYLTDKVWTPFVCRPCKRAGNGVIVEARPQMVYSAWFVGCHDNGFSMRGAA
jgi:hypothetical protein